MQQTVVLLAIVILQASLTAHADSARESARDNPAQSSQADVRKLEVGKPFEREMKGSESRTYEITLEAGQYVHVIVDQRGIDVVVQVSGPDGKQLIEVDRPNGPQGREPVTVIADASGSYS